jgi:hypothetical protein
MTYEERHNQTQWYQTKNTVLNFLKTASNTYGAYCMTAKNDRLFTESSNTDCLVTIATVIANNTKTGEDVLKIAKQAIEFDFYEDAIHYLKTEFKLKGTII